MEASTSARPQQGEELDLRVDALAYGGNGVARSGGYVVFVRGAIPGDRVRAVVTKRKRAYAEALAVEVLESSPDRIAPVAHHPGAPWQVLPYVLLTLGEVLVSATGLEFAYSQAQATMKSAIMAFWSLSVTVGNLWVLLVNAAVRNDAVTQTIAQSGLGVMSFQMFFFAAFAFLAALAFGLYAAGYTLADHYRQGD